MRYDSGGAFRRALEDRLRSKSLSDGTPLIRRRKTRLHGAPPDRPARPLHAQDPAALVCRGVLTGLRRTDR